MSTEAGATINPDPEAGNCDADGCRERELLALVEPDDETASARVLCPTHRVEYLREVASQ
jgi:hypothetical protein